MQYRTYPKTDLRVSEVGFGVWTTSTGWWGEPDDNRAVRMFHEARDLGITFFDAADSYGDGRSEEQLAKAFPLGRDPEIVIATKFGYDFYNHSSTRRGQQEIPHDFSPSYVRFALEQSLRRLNRDHIDLYQIHNARSEQIDDDTLFDLLETFRAEGKIRYYGVALGPAIGWLYEGVDAAVKRQVTSVQMIWNMLEQFPGTPMVEAADAAEVDTGYVVRVPHSSGMLEGRYTADTVFADNDHRRHRPKHWLTNGLEKVKQLRFLEQPERTLGQAAIQWLLAHPRTMSVLPNIYDEEQLREFAAAPDTARLTAEELQRVAELARENFGITEPPTPFKGTMERGEAAATVGAA